MYSMKAWEINGNVADILNFKENILKNINMECH